MTGGFTGKILRLNLTNHTTSVIDTSKYEEYGGGIGIGTAVFWDLVEDKSIDAFDPRNVVTVMGSPLSGTLGLSAAGRTEVNGIGPQAYPIGWFTRSNFGGRFGAEMKYAGWDGIVIEGKSDSPVWVNVVNDRVTFEDASGLWGLDTWTTQQKIWKDASGGQGYGDWLKGPAGTGEFGMNAFYYPPASLGGILAESWEQTDLRTYVFKLRQGVLWHDRPPANGREFVADDVVFTCEYTQTEPGHGLYQPPGTPDEEMIHVTVIDKYTVKVVMPNPDGGMNAVFNVTNLEMLPRGYDTVNKEDWSAVGQQSHIAS